MTIKSKIHSVVALFAAFMMALVMIQGFSIWRIDQKTDLLAHEALELASLLKLQERLHDCSLRLVVAMQPDAEPARRPEVAEQYVALKELFTHEYEEKFPYEHESKHQTEEEDFHRSLIENCDEALRLLRAGPGPDADQQTTALNYKMKSDFGVYREESTLVIRRAIAAAHSKVRESQYLEIGTVLLCMTGLLIAGAMLKQWISVPARTLAEGARRYEAGRFSEPINMKGQGEFQIIGREMDSMAASFHALQTELESKVREQTALMVRRDKLAVVGTLAAGVAHEINNPLAIIVTAAESLMRQAAEMKCPDEMKHTLEDIRSESFRCKEVTTRLLDFARPRTPNIESVDIASVIRSTVDFVRFAVEQNSKSVEFEVQDELIMIEADRDSLRSLILNLLLNAIDATGPGGLIVIRLVETEGQAIISVRDNGEGFDADSAQHLFDPFYTTKTSGHGTGLGLSIVHTIVQEHGGELRADSAGPAMGAEFTVSLPLVQR